MNGRKPHCRARHAGQNLSEYALLIAIVIFACIVALGNLGDSIATAFQDFATNIQNTDTSAR